MSEQPGPTNVLITNAFFWKMLEAGRWLIWWSICQINMGTWVWIPRTHIKSQVWLHVTVTPFLGRWGRSTSGAHCSSHLMEPLSSRFTKGACLRRQGGDCSRRRHPTSNFRLHIHVPACIHTPTWIGKHIANTQKERKRCTCTILSRYCRWQLNFKIQGV